MARLSETDWELINAYADDELSAEDREAVSRRLTYDDSLVAALAEVHATKAGLSLMRPAKVAAPPARRRVGVRHIAAGAVAASLAAIAVLGALYQLGGVTNDWRDTPAVLHAALSENTYVLSEGSALPVVSTARIGNLEVFDLSSSRLTLVDIEIARNDDRDLVAMHYRGRRGCRLTVVAVEALPDDPSPLPARHAGLGVRWSVGPAHYYLLASGMDRDRFDAIAAYAKAESRRLNRRDGLEMAMRDATDKARPCAPQTA